MPNKKIGFAALLLLCGFDKCEDPRVGMAFAGYTQLNPPSNLFVPGAIVILHVDRQNRGELKLVCGPRANLGPHYMPKVSETVSSTLRLSKTQRVELEADAIDKFRSRTSAEDVASVTVAFTNARILEADDSEIFRLIRNRTLACATAIDARGKGGFDLTMVASAFIADVTYDVQFKRSVSMEKKVQLEKMADIATKLGGGHTEVTDHEIKAVNLVIGVKTDKFYMSIRPECLGEFENSLHKPDRLPVVQVTANSDSDAPLVPPAGGWASPVRH